jgi:hypothetical protein
MQQNIHSHTHKSKTNENKQIKALIQYKTFIYLFEVENQINEL